MSLDVYLISPVPVSVSQSEQRERIFIREDGATREIGRDEWDRRFPDRDPVSVVMDDDEYVYTANITHNLGRMASEAGVYDALWRPDEHGLETAGQLIVPLRDGLARLNSERERFEAFNPKNGWGDYDGLCCFIADYLAACERYPEMKVNVSR